MWGSHLHSLGSFTRNHRHSERATTLQLSPTHSGRSFAQSAQDDRRKEFSRTAEAASRAKPCLVAFFRSLVETQQRWGSDTNLEQRIAAASSKAWARLLPGCSDIPIHAARSVRSPVTHVGFTTGCFLARISKASLMAWGVETNAPPCRPRLAFDVSRHN
jgi:hypothetical protein